MKTAVLTITVAAIFIGGCASTGPNAAFHDNGIPKQQYYVGGGYKLTYRAPGVRGTLYIVEAVSQKLILTESLDQLEAFNLDIDPREEDMHMRLKSFGIDPLNAKFELYFVPLEGCERQSTRP
ncbi:MAG: hypothetical protein LLF76_03480 [Planctomycetaceae bacterium]|nr:hypothetical protein [Planctomycetaceae bacterium]